jgi:hypothetical protein
MNAILTVPEYDDAKAIVIVTEPLLGMIFVRVTTVDPVYRVTRRTDVATTELLIRVRV